MATKRTTGEVQAWLPVLRRHRSMTEACEELGLSRHAVNRGLAAQGLGTATVYLGVPAGPAIKSVNTCYDADGQIRTQWVRSEHSGGDKLAALADAVATIAEPFKGLSKLVKAPKTSNADLLTIYPMGDPHLGMFSWAEETGQDFDLKTAEAHLVAAVDKLVALAPPSKTCCIINLGDFFHNDNTANQTSRGHNALDVDTRWPKILRVGIRAMRRCIDKALAKHQLVRVINEIGNHDDHSAIMLSLCLDSYYENNPRVEVDTSPSPFHWLRFGKCLVGTTHGNGIKLQSLPSIMATDRPRDWGETKHRYWYTGHVHHDSLKEYPGCLVETFRTLAARDSWAHGAGYRSGRDMKADVFHREHGRINRHVVGIDMLA